MADGASTSAARPPAALERLQQLLAALKGFSSGQEMLDLEANLHEGLTVDVTPALDQVRAIADEAFSIPDLSEQTLLQISATAQWMFLLLPLLGSNMTAPGETPRSPWIRWAFVTIALQKIAALSNVQAPAPELEQVAAVASVADAVAVGNSVGLPPIRDLAVDLTARRLYFKRVAAALPTLLDPAGDTVWRDTFRDAWTRTWVGVMQDPVYMQLARACLDNAAWEGSRLDWERFRRNILGALTTWLQRRRDDARLLLPLPADLWPAIEAGGTEAAARGPPSTLAQVGDLALLPPARPSGPPPAQASGPAPPTEGPAGMPVADLVAYLRCHLCDAPVAAPTSVLSASTSPPPCRRRPAFRACLEDQRRAAAERLRLAVAAMQPPTPTDRAYAAARALTGSAARGSAGGAGAARYVRFEGRRYRVRPSARGEDHILVRGSRRTLRGLRGRFLEVP